MANEQQASVAHKTSQNTRSIGKARTTSVDKKLSKTVEDFAGLKLSEEKSLQKPPVDATALTLADGGSTEKNRWTTVNNTSKTTMEIDDTHQQSKNKQEKSPNWNGNGYSNKTNTTTTQCRKRFHPTPYQTTQATKGSKEPGYLTTAEQIKLRGAVAIKTVTEVLTPVTIEFLVLNQVKVFHIGNAFIRLFQKVKDTDAALKVLVITSNTKGDLTDLPNGNKFERLFTATYKTSAQGKGRAKIKCNLHTGDKLATIKYANAVFSYLETEKIFINYDAFKTLNTASP
eukprot:2954114-Ditylum_brightwellii.AAC.1